MTKEESFLNISCIVLVKQSYHFKVLCVVVKFVGGLHWDNMSANKKANKASYMFDDSKSNSIFWSLLLALHVLLSFIAGLF